MCTPSCHISETAGLRKSNFVRKHKQNYSDTGQGHAHGAFSGPRTLCTPPPSKGFLMLYVEKITAPGRGGSRISPERGGGRQVLKGAQPCWAPSAWPGTAFRGPWLATMAPGPASWAPGLFQRPSGLLPNPWPVTGLRPGASITVEGFPSLLRRPPQFSRGSQSLLRGLHHCLAPKRLS